MGDALENYEFKKMLRFLSSIRGQGTELISIYIPPGYNISELANRLRAEYSQAENIKSKQTRKNVLGAIERILQAIKGITKPPKNGVAIFCGNIANQPGASNIKLFIVHPPKPIQVQIYRCDSTFFLDPLLEMLEPDEVYGILLIDRKEATLAYLKGKRIEIIQHRDSFVPSKHRAGGQCLHLDTRVMQGDGIITNMANLDPNRGVISVSQFQTTPSEVERVFKRENDEWLEVTTKYPARSIITTGEHWFFVPSEYGFSLKQAWDLQPGDDVLLVKNIRVEGERQRIQVEIPVKKKLSTKGRETLVKRRKKLGISQRKIGEVLGISQVTVSKFELGKGKISLEKIRKFVEYLGIDWEEFEKKYVENIPLFKFPHELSPDLARLLGYITGDGNVENERIRVYDQDLQTVKAYAELARSLFGVNVIVRKRDSRGHYILEIYGKELITTLKRLFPEVFSRKEVPRLIQLSDNKVVAAYISGLIDAEGSITDRGISISMVDKDLMLDVSLLLLRLGVVNSIRKKRVKPSKIRGSRVSSREQTEILITDKDALEKLKETITPLNKKKLDRLAKLRREKTRTSQIWICGRMLINLAREIGMNTMDFKTCSNFFRNEKHMSFSVFKKAIIEPIENRIKELENVDISSTREFRKVLGLKVEDIAKVVGTSVSPIYRLEKDPRYRNKELEKRVREYLLAERDRMLIKAKSTLKFLLDAYKGDLIRAEIKNIRKIHAPGLAIDLAVPKTECFVANGFLVHNSSVRFERLIEIAAHEWFKKVGEMANQYFSDSKIKGVIIGGPGPTKNYFLNGDYLNHMVRNKIVGIVDTSYTDEFGVREVLEKSGEIMKELAVVKEKRLLDRFIKEISRDGLATYGEKEVRQALFEGRVDTLLISEDLTWERIKFKCPQCGYEEEVTVRGEVPRKVCPKCGSVMNIEERQDLIEELAKLAEETGAKVELISTETVEGKQFYETFGGIGALLRFK